jgi:glycosyltransferase involved in cell wall biosynthesis
MKVLNINYSEIEGGAAIACNRLHKAFLECKINSLLLVNNKITNDRTVIEINNNYFFKKIFSKIINILLSKFDKTYHSISYFNSTVLNKIEEINPDIVHLNWIGNEMISIEEISKIQRSVVWTFQDMWAFTGTEHYTFKKNYFYSYKKKKNNFNFFSFIFNWTWNRKKKFFKKNLHIVCSSKWMKTQVFNSSIFYKNKNITIIPNCLDFKRWKPFNKLISRKFLKLPYLKKYILFVSSNGSDDERKGFNFLLKAIEELNIKNLHLIVVGKLSDFHRRVIPINFTVFDEIKYTEIDFLIKIYSASDLIVVPSVMESFGQVVVEAASCNVPAVVFNNTGLTDIVQHKKNGYVAKFKNYKDLANGIRWCLKKNELKKKLRIKTAKKFSSDIVANKYISLFKDILKYNKFSRNVL